MLRLLSFFSSQTILSREKQGFKPVSWSPLVRYLQSDQYSQDFETKVHQGKNIMIVYEGYGRENGSGGEHYGGKNSTEYLSRI